MDAFAYTSLNLDQPSFRLIRLIGGEGPIIECEIFQSPIVQEAPIPYEALSYTWGLPERVATIVANGKQLSVTNNLYIALSYLRHELSDRILWVDALCIDQDNILERNHQVRQMVNIYENAENVIFWLGQATYETNVAMESLRRLEAAAASVACRQWAITDDRWQDLWFRVQGRLSAKHSNLEEKQCKGLEDLLSRSWFERVWIIQEVAQARRARVYCGKKSVSAPFFALAPCLLPVKPSLQTQAILDVFPGQSRNDSWWQKEHDLYTLLCKFRHSKARDPRDLVYALLGIASKHDPDRSLYPDYRKSEEDVVKETISYLFYLDIDLLPETTNGYWIAMVQDDSMAWFLASLDGIVQAAMDQQMRSEQGAKANGFLTNMGQNVRITDEMLHIAKASEEQGVGASAKQAPRPVSMLQLLIKTHGGQEMLQTAAESWRVLDWVSFLLQTQSTKIRIDESSLKRAILNPDAHDMLSFLLDHTGSDVHVTADMLEAAAKSLYSKDILLVLLLWREDEVVPSQEIVDMIQDGGQPQRSWALELLRDWGKAVFNSKDGRYHAIQRQCS